MKNKIHTLSYFKKRLKDNGYIVWDIMKSYALSDPRKWTLMINPSDESIFITCVVNRDDFGGLPEFEINDSGLRFQRNLVLKTSSMEVLINLLTERGVLGNSTKYSKKHANDT